MNNEGSERRERQELVTTLVINALVSSARFEPGTVVARMLKNPEMAKKIQSLTSEDFQHWQYK
jgi:hypothetical protein